MTTMGIDHGTRPTWGSRAFRRSPAVIVAAVLALVLSGCVKLEMDLDLSSDNTVDGSLVFAIDKDLLTLGGQDPAEAFAEALTESPFPTEGTDGGSVTTEVYDQDGKYGARYVLTDMPVDTFDDEDLRIVREGDFFVVTGTLDLSSGDSGEPGPMPTELMGGFDVMVAVTFPGEVVEHNGTLEGTTVTWRLEDAGVLEMSAKGAATEPAGSGVSSETLTYGGIALAVLLLGALLAFLLLRRRKAPVPVAGTSDGSGAAAPAGAPDGPGTSPDTQYQATLVLTEDQAADPPAPDPTEPGAQGEESSTGPTTST